MEQRNTSKGPLSIKFEGDTTIDADLLLNSMTNILQAYKSSISSMYAGVECELRIKSFEKGSFNVLLDTVISGAPAVMGYIPPAVECAKNFLELIKIKRDLHGEKPKSIEEKGSRAGVTNSNGTTNYYNSNVTNIYFNNPIIDSSLSKAIQSIAVSDRPALTISGESDALSISRREYKEMMVPVVEENELDVIQTLESDVRELLLLKSPDFLGDSKWDFLYKGRTIHATIADDFFQEQVKKGRVSLSAGVKIPVLMHIEVKYDRSLQPIKESYTILEVTGSIVRPEDYEQEQSTIQEIYFSDDDGDPEA